MALNSRYIWVFILFVYGETQLYSTLKASHHPICPQIYQKIFKGYVPQGNLSAGS